MKNDFDYPLHTCMEKSCESCSLRHKLNCHFSRKQKLFFIINHSIHWGIIFYALPESFSLPITGMLIAAFLFWKTLEIKIKCSYCPHYANPNDPTVSCWKNYGFLKLFKFQHQPLINRDKILFLGGLIAFYSLPLSLIAWYGEWLFLALDLINLLIFFETMLRKFCRKCVHFYCVFNHVEQSLREEFFLKNPQLYQTLNVKFKERKYL